LARAKREAGKMQWGANRSASSNEFFHHCLSDRKENEELN